MQHTTHNTQQRSTKMKYNTQEHMRRTTWKDTNCTQHTTTRNAQRKVHEPAYMLSGCMKHTTEKYKNEVPHRTVYATDNIEGHELYATHELYAS